MKQPNKTVGTVEMVSVEWILKNVNRSVDFGLLNAEVYSSTWADVVEYKGADLQMSSIIWNIMTFGFRVPIVLDLGKHHSSITLGNGHHRLTAAILMVLDEIPVYWADNDYMSVEYSDCHELIDPTDDEWHESSLEDLLA